MNAEKPKILVVDDEPDIVELLKRFLEKKGYEVTGAHSGNEALKSLEKQKADLVLLDMKMPGLNGAEVAKIAKRKYPSTKFVMLTGFPNSAEKLAKANILEDILIKPIKMQELFNRLIDILGQEKDATTWKPQQKIKGRILLIKAKLLFLEPSSITYNLLSEHFKLLSAAGEDYETQQAGTEDEVHKKSILFKPNIYIANASFLKKKGNKLISSIPEESYPYPEIITYDTDKAGNIDNAEIDKVTKAVQTTCLKHGFIGIKWIDI
ncbi:MAG: response regulator [Candidatus Omnitrophota bacterium]